MEGQALVSNPFCLGTSFIWSSADLCAGNRGGSFCLYIVLSSETAGSVAGSSQLTPSARTIRKF